MEIGHDRANIDQRLIRASMARRGSVGGIGDLDMGPYVGTGEAHPLVDTGPLGAASAACKWEVRVLHGWLPDIYACPNVAGKSVGALQPRRTGRDGETKG